MIIKNLCSICGNCNTIVKRNHLLNFVKCKDCDHLYSLVEDNNKIIRHNSLNKKIKQINTDKISNILEYSFCPYWELMKIINKVNVIQVKDNFESYEQYIQNQYFSKKSIILFANNLKVNYNFEYKDNIGYITLL